MPEPEVHLEIASPPRTGRRAKSGRWPQSAATKQAVLAAASTLFAEQGYDATTINDIVKLSGVSVGSIYHQFGGKAEVFVALAQEMVNAHAKVSAEAAKEAMTAGETRPVELYIAGARAYLLDMWTARGVSRILLGDDGPPGFAAVRRETEARFLRGVQGFVIGKPPLPESSAYAVISLIQAAALQIIEVSDRDMAVKIADYFTGLIRRLADPPGQ